MAKQASVHNIIQGSSYALDLKTASYPVLDVDWTGSWAIVTALGVAGTTVASGALAVSSDSKTMEMRITGNTTEGIVVGDYYLIVQIENAVIGFRDEPIQETLTIKPQGIFNP